MNDDQQNIWQQSLYDKLHTIAEKALAGEKPGHSLQPTLLVDDAYLRLLAQRNVDPEDREQVLAAGANIIRRILVDYARRRKAEKRGGAQGRGVSLQVAPPDKSSLFNILELSDLLAALGKQNARAALVVELRFFGGLTMDEIANQLSVSRRTAQMDWRYAKAWLYDEMGYEADAASEPR